MTEPALHTLPRLCVDVPLIRAETFSADADAAHYLKNVLRQQQGDCVRLFNGRDGEWQAEIVQADKKAVILKPREQIRPQPDPGAARIHLIFPLLRKNRLEWILEKAVELGVDEFHPVITEHSEVRERNAERMTAQIREAAEQCERLTLPVLHPLLPLSRLLAAWPSDLPLLAAIERMEAPPLARCLAGLSSLAVLAGPEGGFSAQEKEKLIRHPAVRAVSLGPAILRAETALLTLIAGVQIQKFCT